VSPPFLYPGGSTTGLSATDAQLVFAGDVKAYAESIRGSGGYPT
jgi:hypothetical protein